jgi:predicted nucleic acid-binding protein
VTSVLVDTGFLVSLFRPADRLRAQARECLLANRRPLLTAAPVIVETCLFLDATGKGRLLEWAQRGAVAVAEVPVSSYAEIGTIIRKYADRRTDFADATLVWLANHTGMRDILTVDEADFSVYRLKGGKRFALVKWFA